MALLEKMKRERVQHADRAKRALAELIRAAEKSDDGIDDWEAGIAGLPEFDAAAAAKAIDAVARYVVAAESHAAAVREQS